MRKVQEVIVVEGRYDKNTLSQIVDATIVPVSGFSVFKNRETVTLLRKMAEKRGLILLTDSDGAGFVIRNFLKGQLPKEQIKQAYIPDVYGKEKRKRTAGKEGKLGVEGMAPEVLLRALERAGATFLDAEQTVLPEKKEPPLTKADLFEMGLTGGSDSAERRRKLLRALELPEHMTANALLEALNLLYDRDEVMQLMEAMGRE